MRVGERTAVVGAIGQLDLIFFELPLSAAFQMY